MHGAPLREHLLIRSSAQGAAKILLSLVKKCVLNYFRSWRRICTKRDLSNTMLNLAKLDKEYWYLYHQINIVRYIMK